MAHFDGWAETKGVRLPTVKVAAVSAALALILGLPALSGSPAAAADGLAGRWVSDSLRDNRIGYYLVLRPAPGRSGDYVGRLRFERQDGSRDSRIPVAARVVGKNWLIVTARQGSFDRGGRTLKARLDGRGTLILTNCLSRLQQVMSWDLASDCTLRRQR